MFRLLGDEMFRVSLRLRRDLVFDKIDDRSFALTPPWIANRSEEREEQRANWTSLANHSRAG